MPQFISPTTVWALLQATIVVVLLLLVSGAGSPAMTLDGRGDPATADAVDILIDQFSADPDRRPDLIGSIPDGFVSVMGYRPQVIDVNGSVSLGKPIGTCSSPVHLAFDMEPTCKGHDFGYDLLRYAAVIGAPLGAWARPLIDDWWYAEMHERCSLTHAGVAALACHGQVLATEVIIDVNSWREGNGPPIEENPWRYLGALALLPVAVAAAVRSRRNAPLHPIGGLQAAPAAFTLTR